jgi:hypothetical protein
MQTLEDRIRSRAYEIWERAGRTGDPEDHWRQAEEELAAEPAHAEPDSAMPEPDATVEAVQPAAAVEAAAAVGAASSDVAAANAPPPITSAKRSRGKRAS